MENNENNENHESKENSTIDAEYTENNQSTENATESNNSNVKQSNNISSDEYTYGIVTYTYGIVTYMTLIGFLIAICSVQSKDRSDYLKFHLNQSLVIHLFALLSALPVIGWLWCIFIFIVWLLALIGACQRRMTKVILFGDIHILN